MRKIGKLFSGWSQVNSGDKYVPEMGEIARNVGEAKIYRKNPRC